MTDAENIPDIDHGLASLTEETTAAEFLRSKGQHKKVKTINKEKLKQWITQAIVQTRAGMADSYNDEEKEELLKKTQEQLEEVMARAAKAEAEVKSREGAKADMAAEIEALQARAADAENRDDKSEELKAAMLALTKVQGQFNQAHKEAEDLRLDVYELQDQLNMKMALSRSTMEEKDRLKETMQGLMIRAGDLTGGVLGLDQDYYAGQHASESVIDEDAELTEQFFHDFEVGAKVIESLSNDLAKLRSITSQQAEDEASASAAPTHGLLSADLALLEQLKSGSLSAADVAQPVDGLIEALTGAREEAMVLEKEAAAAMGMPQTASTISPLPDSDGDPAEVIAGATAVTRELAALFAKERNRISALQMMIDEADSARNSEEADAEQQHQSYDALLAHIAAQSQAAGINIDAAVTDTSADAATRVQAAEQAVESLATHAAQSSAAKYYHALLNNIKQQAEELGIQTSAAIGDDQADLPSRNAAAAQAVLELAQKAADTSVIENYDALLGDIAEQAEAAGVEHDGVISDADASAPARNAAAINALAALAQKATDDRVQNNYDALLERIAEEARASELEGITEESLTNNDVAIESRQAEAEKVLTALADKSAAASDLTELQEQLDEALQNVDITHADSEEISDELEPTEASGKPDHDAVKTLFASRIGNMVAKIKELEQQRNATAADKEALAQKITEVEQALTQKEEALQAALDKAEAAKGDQPHEKELARAVMKAVQGDESLAGDDSVLDLALAIDDYNDEIADEEEAKNLVEQSAAVIKALGARKLELMTELAQIKASQLDRDAKVEEMERLKTEAEQERNEMAESGKEIIGQLTQQRDAKVKESEEAKQALRGKDLKLNELEGLVHEFADQLGPLSEDEADQSEDVAAAKAQLRNALAKMPGEKSVPLHIGVASEVTRCGIALTDALTRDGGAQARSLQENLQQAQTAAQEKESQLKQLKNDIHDQEAALAALQEAASSNKKALTDLQENLANKEQELAALQEAVAAKEAEAQETQAGLQENLANKEQELAALQETVAAKDIEVLEAKAEAEEMAASGKEVIGHLNEQRDKQQLELAKLQTQLSRLEEAEAANRKMAEQISALAAIAEQHSAGEELSDMQADLEVTLSEVPGEEEVPVRAGLSKDLADSSIAIVDAIGGQLAAKSAALAKAEAERDELKGILRQSRAAIEEYRARNEESSSSNEGELRDLSGKLAEAEKLKDKLARDLQEQIDDYRLEENVLKKKVDELNKQVRARDEEILAFKRLEDTGADKQVELSSLREQNNALVEELKASKSRLDELEAMHSAAGGKDEFAVGGLKSEVNKLRQEREELRTRMRGVEDELASEKSRVESLKEDRQNLRAEFDQERQQIQAALEREKTAHGDDMGELKRLRSELVGVQARVRALSESGDSEQA